MSSLNEQQQKAVDLNADKILCLAGAGTGKTFCMLSRISRLVDDGADPSSILVLTFTNAAAFEMRERYKRNHSERVVPEFRTFHSFCYSIISRDGNVREALGYTKVPKIATDAELHRIETLAKEKCGTKLSNDKIKGKVPLTPKEQFELDVYNKCVDRILKSSGLITFNILCYDVCDLFVTDHESILDYKERYKYLFVDEFQDTDPRQYDFITSFKDSSLFVVGDALQAIYSFRGADSSIIMGLANSSDWQTVKLFKNYRSTEEICDFANSNSNYADDSYRIEIEGQRYGSIAVSVTEGATSRYTQIVDNSNLDDVLFEMYRMVGDSAILCRTNAEVSYVIEYLKAKGITPRTGKRNIDAEHILKSACDNTYMLDWLSTFLNSQKYTEFIRLMEIEQPENKIKFFIDNFGTEFKITLNANRIIKIRNILKSEELPFVKCKNILDILDMSNVVVDTNAITPREIVDYLVEAVQSDSSSDIYVGTIHSSKGLEYDNVYLLGVDCKSFKLNNQENNNLYYVGITRAKNYLHVFKA